MEKMLRKFWAYAQNKENWAPVMEPLKGEDVTGDLELIGYPCIRLVRGEELWFLNPNHVICSDDHEYYSGLHSGSLWWSDVPAVMAAWDYMLNDDLFDMFTKGLITGGFPVMKF